LSLFPLKRGIPKRFIKGQPYNVAATQTHKFTVPDGKIWQIVSVSAKRIDSSAMDISLYDKDNHLLNILAYSSAATGLCAGPEYAADYATPPLLAFEKDYIQFGFVTAQTTGGDYVVLVVIEFDEEDLLT